MVAFSNTWVRSPSPQCLWNYRAFLFSHPQQLLLLGRWVTEGGRWLGKGHGLVQEPIGLRFTATAIRRCCDSFESDGALKRILPAVTSADCIMVYVTVLMNSMVNDRLAWWLMMNMRGCMTSSSSLWGRPWQRVSDRMVALKVFSFTAWNTSRIQNYLCCIKKATFSRFHSVWKSWSHDQNETF